MKKICLVLLTLWVFSSGYAANPTDGGKDTGKVVKISDDFVKESGMWSFDRGDWKVSGGILAQTQNSAPHIAYCLLKNPMRLNALGVKFLLKPQWQGLVFTWAGSPDSWASRYEVFMFPSVIALRKFSGGNQQDAAIFRKAPSAGTWHDLRINCGVDGQITVNMDGEEIIKWQDLSPFFYLGSISLGTYCDTKAEFKDFTAEGMAGTPDKDRVQ